MPMGSLCTICSAVMTCPVHFFFIFNARLFWNVLGGAMFCDIGCPIRESVLMPPAASRQVPAFVPTTTISLCGKNVKIVLTPFFSLSRFVYAKQHDC